MFIFLLCSRFYSLCYHFTSSGLQSHYRAAFHCACVAVESCMIGGRVEATIPYFEVATQCFSRRTEGRTLSKLLARSIAFTKEKIAECASNDVSQPVLHLTLNKVEDLLFVVRIRQHERSVLYKMSVMMRSIFTNFGCFSRKGKVYIESSTSMSDFFEFEDV